MKKLLIVLSVIVFFSISAFASVTSIAKEGSEAGYPGLLTKGSVLGTDTFVADISLLGNIALIDYIDDMNIGDDDENLNYSNYYYEPSGLIVLKTDLGTLGLSVNESFDPYLQGVNGNDMNTLGLMFGTSMDAMNLGARVSVGMENWGYDNKDLVNNAGYWGLSNEYGWADFDVVSTSATYVGVKLGVALKGGLDIAIGAAMNNEYTNYKDKNNIAGGTVIYDEVQNQGKLGFDLTARQTLGNGFTAVLGGIFNMGTDIENYKYWTAGGTLTDDWTNTESNMYIEAKALIGKDIKASESLTVKIATGATFYSDSRPKNVYKDNMPAGETTYDNGTKWSELNVFIPINVAVEGKLNDMWSINAGVNATLLGVDSLTYKRNALNTTEDWQNYSTEGWLDINPSINYALGVTGKIGDLTLDCWLDPSILIDGPNLLTGNTSSYLNYGVSLSYGWK